METETLNPSSSSPPPPEPAHKKLKLSPSTTADAGPTRPRYKRRKVAIFFAYCGVGYQGMQKNPGAKTIEGDLEQALELAGAVPEPDIGHPKRWDWARSARTDKGVSAVGQVVSGRFYVDPPGFVDRLNSHLPEQIRIFGYKRVTPTFNAKKFCDRRRYVYLLPVFALDPNFRRDMEIVSASSGVDVKSNDLPVVGSDGVEQSDISSNSEATTAAVESLVVQNQVAAISVESEGVVQSGISSNTQSAIAVDESVTVPKGGVSVNVVQSGILSNTQSAMAADESVTVPKEEDSLVGSENVFQSVILSNTQSAMAADESVTVPKEGSSVQLGISSNTQSAMAVDENSALMKEDSQEAKRSEFSYGEKERERFNRILKHFEGTHNFHNFTTRTKAEDPSAKRYIVSFNANSTITIEGIEFVRCEVVGQSFMLHQIRKMIGTAVAIMRDISSESIFDTAFQQDIRINVPMAPEVGLFLDECLFTSYNNRWGHSHEVVSMKAFAEEAEEFKMKHIYSHIANAEHKEGPVALWLQYLNRESYPDLCGASADAPKADSAEV